MHRVLIMSGNAHVDLMLYVIRATILRMENLTPMCCTKLFICQQMLAILRP
jgi:hypothetical protein